MSTITALVHTKNSATTLEACLQSLKWCDELWVVDMESTDKTVSIAKKYATHVYGIKTTDATGKQIRIVEQVRNEFLKKVKTDWTLIVDSDEEIPTTLTSKIKEAMLTQGINGYQIPRKNLIFGKWIEHTGFWPDYIVRLFRTGTGEHPIAIHQQLQVQGTTESFPAKEEYAIVHHHYDSIEQFMLRLNVYTTFEAERMAAASEQDPTQFDFIKAFFDQFLSRFFAQQGYKDGTNGLVLSLLMAVYTMVAHMKMWEKTKPELPLTLEDVEASVNESCSHTTYWVANEELQEEKNILKKVELQFRRKVHT